MRKEGCCSKKTRAFKWHFLAPKDVPEFAVRLLPVVIISLVMPFGWVGAPGEFVAWSAAAKAHHGSFHPPDPWFNHVVSYESKWLMDDGVVLEPLVGNRVFHSLACLDRTMIAVWGPEGVNVEKMAEEGEPSGCQLLWGLYMDFDQKIISLPEPKRMKAKYLLAEPALSRGHKGIPLRLLQEVAGCAQYWWIVCPGLLPRLPALYHPMKGQGGHGSVDTSAPGEGRPSDERGGLGRFLANAGFYSAPARKTAPVLKLRLTNFYPSGRGLPFRALRTNSGFWEAMRPSIDSAASTGKTANLPQRTPPPT